MPAGLELALFCLGVVAVAIAIGRVQADLRREAALNGQGGGSARCLAYLEALSREAVNRPIVFTVDLG